MRGSVWVGGLQKEPRGIMLGGGDLSEEEAPLWGGGGLSGAGPGRGWGGGDLRGVASRGSEGPGGVARVWRWARARTDAGSGWVREPSPVREGAGWAGEGPVRGWARPTARPRPAPLAASGPPGAAARASVLRAGRGGARTDTGARPPACSMWKLGRSRVLLDEPPEEEDGLRGGAPPATAPAAAQVRGRRGGGARGAGRVMRVGMSGAEAWPRSGGGAQVGRAGEARAARPFNFPRLVRARPLCPVVTAPPATLRMTEPSAPPPLARVWDGGRSSRRWEPRAVAFQRRGGNCLPSGRDPGPGPGPSVQRRVRGRAPGWAGFTGEAWTGGGHRPAGEVRSFWGLQRARRVR